MLLIFGLGNPEKKYQNTRHNTGFLILDKIRETWGFPPFKFNKKLNASISEGDLKFKIQNSKFLLVKPETFMNLSGEAVRKALAFWKLAPKNILVIHDDIDIPLGKYKIARDSRSAGHKGVQNIIDQLGTQKFLRFRIGTKPETEIKEANDFVLEKFSKEELEKIKKTSEDVLAEQDWFSKFRA